MKKDLLKFLVLLAVAGGSAPAYSAYWNWSRTAATNANADPTINWAEGMAPSAVNDSARAQMARSAEQRDDTSGLLTTTGTATAYLVTTYQGLQTPTPTDGQHIAITVNATNGASPTLAADGGTAFPIQSSPGVAVASGTLVLGSPYTLRFSVANSAWLLRDYYNLSTAFQVPLGAMLPFTGDTAPNSNFVLPYGQAISRTTYAAYFAQVGTRFGVGDGSTTFNVPDLRERTIFGSGAMGGGADPGRITAGKFGSNPNTIGSVGGVEASAVAQANLPALTLPSTLAISDTVSWSVNNGTNVINASAGSNANLTGGGAGDFFASVTLTKSGSVSLTGSTTTGGSGTTLPTIDPGIILNFILRIQ